MAGVSAQDMKAFQILLAVLAGASLVCFVIYERRRSANPCKSEKALAYGWLVFRRVVCLLVVAFFGVVAVAVLLSPKDGASFLSVAGSFLFCVFVAFMATWVGIYGGGRLRSMRDDKAVHQERKRRYGWRW